MRIKVELHKNVVRYIRHECTEEEQGAFFGELERLRSDPVTLIENSEAIADPELARYMLRFFRFGENIAIFEYDIGKNRIRVLECRKPRPRQVRKQEANDDK